MEKIKVSDGKYIYTVSDEILFVDHSKTGRSGHLGHGMVETEPGRVIAFYPDNSGDKWSGHTAEGYAKYRISEDGGKTWGDGIDFPFSKTLCDMNIDVFSSVEKAVRAKSGDIVAFNFICDLLDNNGCGYEPFRIPSYVISRDGGLTWGEPKKICPRRARIYDARVFNGDIYVLINYGENSTDKTKLTVYHMLKAPTTAKLSRIFLRFRSGLIFHTRATTERWKSSRTARSSSIRTAIFTTRCTSSIR